MRNLIDALYATTISVPDFINGAFEASGGYFIYQSIKKLHHDKLVRGVSWRAIGFFGAWGYWNLFYYPHLDQWVSFLGGVGITITNTIWFVQIIFYLKAEHEGWRYSKRDGWHRN